VTLVFISYLICLLIFTFLETPNPCTLPPKAGVGHLSILRYFYNQDISRCEKFLFRGSKGNANNFLTLDQCIRTCESEEESQQNTPHIEADISEWSSVEMDYQTTYVKEKVCFQRADTGPCTDLIMKYFYSPFVEACQPFFYGGCLGNTNRFNSWEECNAFCNF